MDGSFYVLSGQDRFKLGAADNLAHRAFRDRLHRTFRLLDVEKIIARAVGLDQPEHRKIDIDDVLVAGEHQAFRRHLARRGAAAQILHVPDADIDAVDARDLGRKRRLDGVWQVVIETWLDVADVFAETQHHAELVGLNAEEAGQSPDGNRGKHDQCEPLAAEIPARQHVAQLVLAAAQKLLEIGRCRSGLLRALASTSSRSPGPAALIAPRHRLSPRYAPGAVEPLIGKASSRYNATCTRHDNAWGGLESDFTPPPSQSDPSRVRGIRWVGVSKPITSTSGFDISSDTSCSPISASPFDTSTLTRPLGPPAASLTFGVTSAAMPSFSNTLMMWAAVTPPPAGAVWPMDFAASSARLSASAEDTSGFGAPLRTAMPMPVRATSVRPGATLPCLISSSSTLLSTTMRSAGSPPLKRRESPPEGP